MSKLVIWILACAPACAQLPDGPGKDVTVRICGNCHDIDVIAGYHQGKQAWSGMIAQMIEKGAEGTEDEFKAVLDYLVKNFRLDDSRIKTIGLAKQADSPAGTVEIKIYPTAAPRETTGGH